MKKKPRLYPKGHKFTHEDLESLREVHVSSKNTLDAYVAVLGTMLTEVRLLWENIDRTDPDALRATLLEIRSWSYEALDAVEEMREKIATLVIGLEKKAREDVRKILKEAYGARYFDSTGTPPRNAPKYRGPGTVDGKRPRRDPR